MSSKRHARRAEEMKEFRRKLRNRCPACGKVYASTEDEAWELARRQYARFGGEEPKRVYDCGGGKFHWTRQETYTPKPQPGSFYTEDHWS